MIEIILAVLSFLGPLLKFGVEWLLTRGKVSDESRKNLEDAYRTIVSERHRSIKKIKKLEDRLGKEQDKMKEILDGKRKFAWQKDKVDTSAPKQ